MKKPDRIIPTSRRDEMLKRRANDIARLAVSDPTKIRTASRPTNKGDLVGIETFFVIRRR